MIEIHISKQYGTKQKVPKELKELRTIRIIRRGGFEKGRWINYQEKYYFEEPCQTKN